MEQMAEYVATGFCPAGEAFAKRAMAERKIPVFTVHRFHDLGIALVMLIATPLHKGLLMTIVEGLPLLVIAAVLWWLRHW
jgi:hypothetical protein